MQLGVTNVEYVRRHQTVTEDMNHWGKDKQFYFGRDAGDCWSHSLPPSVRTVILTLPAHQDT